MLIADWEESLSVKKRGQVPLLLFFLSYHFTLEEEEEEGWGDATGKKGVGQ